MSTKQRAHPNLPLPDHILYPDRYDADDYEEQKEREEREYTKFGLNLGAETPRTPNLSSPNALDESYLASQLSTLQVPSNDGQIRGRLWRPASFSEKHRRRDALMKEKRAVHKDRDCDICFEYAVNPARTVCCGKLYCTEHITDWLQGPSSDGRCPSCGAISTSILALPSSSTTNPITPPPSQTSSRPRSRNDGKITPLTPAIPSISIDRASPTSMDEDLSSSSEDDSSSSDSWSQTSQGSGTRDHLTLHHSSSSSTKLASSSPADTPLDTEMMSKAVGNFLCVMGLVLVVYVLFA